MAFKFSDPEIQKAWEGFNQVILPELFKIGDKVPKHPSPKSQDVEESIRALMECSFNVAKWIGNLEYYWDVAHSQAMMEVWERNPKASTTMIKSEADGMVANVTGILAKAKHTYKAIELSLMGCQSSLKRMP